MPFPGFFRERQPDIKAMEQARDINGLISLLDNENFDIQWHAADALGSLGPDAIPSLVCSLGDENSEVR